MSEQVILFGPGAVGRLISRMMIEAGNPPVMFADNNPMKHGTMVGGVVVHSPADCKRAYPDALWVPTVQREDYVQQLTEQIASMRVRTVSLWNFLPQPNTGIPADAKRTIVQLAGDDATVEELIDQEEFRKNPDCKAQLKPTSMDEEYFPTFIKRRDDEHFVDCGAADGDTVKAFVERWKQWSQITTFEPDAINQKKLVESTCSIAGVVRIAGAVSDFAGRAGFSSTGDCSSYIDPTKGRATDDSVQCYRLDDLLNRNPPTFIKMDIEGSELDALWGARRIIREHAPVLAICVYHDMRHLWEIPLLIHALQPNYKLFLRRYRPGMWDMVYYAVPSERIKY